MGGARVLVARQPVLGADLEVRAYRLSADAADVADALSELNGQSHAARVLHDAFLAMNVRHVTAGKPAYVPMTADMVRDGTALVLPPPGLVIELAPDVRLDEPTVDALRDLRARGYRVALAGYQVRDPRVEVVRADIAVVPSGEGAAAATRHARSRGLEVLIGGVADAAAYLTARDLAPDGYEGTFLHGPALVEGRRLEGSRLAYLELLRAVQSPEIDFDDVEDRIKRDVTLSWKFLNYANAAIYGWRARMTTIRQVLVLLGEDGVRRWVSVATIGTLAEGLPSEVVVAAISRARFAEGVASCAQPSVPPLRAFLAGMFSLLGAVVEEPVGPLLAQVAVPDDVADAVVGREGRLGLILDLVEAYETASWHAVREACDRLAVDPSALLDCYVDAVEWASAGVASSAVTPSGS